MIYRRGLELMGKEFAEFHYALQKAVPPHLQAQEAASLFLKTVQGDKGPFPSMYQRAEAGDLSGNSDYTFLLFFKFGPESI